MRILGLIGGISWISTAEYYKQINEGINKQLGGLNFSHCIIHSFNYADIKKNNDTGDWEATFHMLSGACRHLKNSGAEAIVLCASTMHFLADRLEETIGLTLIHIAKATASEVEKRKLKKVGLLGTKFTMELDFFTSKLSEKGIEVIIPKEDDRAFIHSTIGDELGKGIVTKETRKRYIAIADGLIQQGAEGIILGCTEIPLVILPADVPVPVFDTVIIHAKAAVAFALD